MRQNRILFTGFKNPSRNIENSSAILLEMISNVYSKFLFTNDYSTIKSEIKRVFKKEYDYVIMFGQKPLLKQLSIEIMCKQKQNILETNFLLEELLCFFKENQISYKISRNPGTSYCNYAYYYVLKYLNSVRKRTKVIFIHVPYKKNFIEFDKLVKMINKENSNEKGEKLCLRKNQ